MNPKRRIAITGIGMVTPVGNDAPPPGRICAPARAASGAIHYFDASGFPVRIGAEVKDFELPRRAGKLEAPQVCLALASVRARRRRGGVGRRGHSPGAGQRRPLGLQRRRRHDGGELSRIGDRASPLRQRGRRISTGRFAGSEFPADPVAFCRTQTNAGLALLTQHFGIRGYATAVHTACASGGQALGTALKVMRRGTADFMLAGGFDSMLNPIGLASFCLLGALSTDNDTPERASRPFDATRNGFVLGEGAGFLVLEEWQAARKRGAHIYAELAGDGNSLSSYRITDSPPDGDGPIQAMQQALADAGVTPEDVDYVNAHGTSTLMNDRSECAALRAVMGEHVERVAVSSTKSCMGHLIAAAGAVEAGVCALAIRDGIAPVNANHRTPDPDCEVNLVRGESRPMRIRAALSNSLGFGGSNSSLVFRHPDEVKA